MKRITLIIIIALLVLFLVFVLQNTAVVPLTFIVWSFETSRAVLVFVTLLVGILIGMLLHRTLEVRLRRRRDAN